MLIDGGSTHNFVDQSLVLNCGLPVLRDKKFQVWWLTVKKLNVKECV